MKKQSLKEKLREIVYKHSFAEAAYHEAINLISDSCDMHGEDATKLFEEFLKNNYDEQGDWVGED